MDPVLIALGCGVLGLVVAYFLARFVLSQDEGNARVREIAAAIKEGALAFLGREYRVLAVFVAIVTLVLVFVPALGWKVALAFVFGAICSGLAGYVGMTIAVRANSRTAAAAAKSLNHGLKVSFRAGSVMGMTVVAIGLLGLSLLYFAFSEDPSFLAIIPGYGFGASSVAIFARVGGGIYTKGADTGADIVGKVEQSIPEDDPRNAAVIADFVGDNVGDVAGMGADLFESYVDSIIATMALSTIAIFSTRLGEPLIVGTDPAAAFWLPMLVAAGGILASIVGIFSVRVGEKLEMKALLNALRRGTYIAAGLSLVFSFIAVSFLADIRLFVAIVAGLAAGLAIGESTNYFTSYVYKPTLKIAEASQTGAATNIIAGFGNGLMSTAPPVLFIVIAVVVAYNFGDIYGVALAGVGMLATLGIQDATDAYGPVADNAGGIVEMAGMPHEIRERTDALDSLGNTTAAIGKGFAIGSAGLTALALLLSYTLAVGITPSQISLLDPHVLVGLFLGGLLPAVFCAMTLQAVGKTGASIVNEVRRQFREIPGLMEGTGKAEYAKCVDICTREAIRQMILPGVVTVLAPITVAFIFGKVALGGFLIGATVTGFILAVAFSNAGGSWDNAKKWVETGAYGGKKSPAHKATVIGDTVGDPMKDTSGPSLNIMIKLVSIISLVLAPVIADMTGIF
ncbi:vacuolar-type H(+)-translocating pyrophosphatase [Dehalogenimonas alkenigignens]|uniref:Putative K(+)-stimulated pyrophosphate-energized sodium pump n=1 Tax=Dehalogenimonas alkenigignens TaxID=1217799 RepID=A0A0W0GJG7_9CHLR|nr:sodium-translocating pyrophosphatase [Dehalogenimonas alkenigignens]KTB48710.1 vacuolar-type H(+)-translocating pyrophosphatase [Dehalogenimonas alkenigignens]